MKQWTTGIERNHLTVQDGQASHFEILPNQIGDRMCNYINLNEHQGHTLSVRSGISETHSERPDYLKALAEIKRLKLELAQTRKELKELRETTSYVIRQML
ncbi:MAG: hypothetical protein WCG50_17215 [Rhodoferax sp.]|uniref:hypothetical protein n=1 Tax=Rhodoferax sp. TaxID=50421 RepID=UPI0030171BF6